MSNLIKQNKMVLNQILKKNSNLHLYSCTYRNKKLGTEFFQSIVDGLSFTVSQPDSVTVSQPDSVNTCTHV